MNQRTLKIGIIAGEHSGDILGEGLIRALHQKINASNQYDEVEFIGIGGPKMEALGCKSLYQMEELAVMGLVEVLSRLPRLLSIRKKLVEYFIDNPPDLFIGIDAPDFNIGLENRLKQNGIKTVHYVSPSVWAWRQKRIFKIQKATNLVLALLPFEKAFYDRFNVPCQFVGHTLADDIPLEIDTSHYRQKLALPLDKKIVAIMPGSRGSEISMLAASFFEAMGQYSELNQDIVFVVPCVNEAKKQLIEKIKEEVAPALKVTYFVGNSRDVMACADCILLASGTATLEAMLLKKPMVVAYRFKWLSYHIFKRIVKTKYFSLPNLLADKAMVPELFQDEVNSEQIIKHVEHFLKGDTNVLVSEFNQLHQSIKLNASEQSANAVLSLIENNK